MAALGAHAATPAKAAAVDQVLPASPFSAVLAAQTGIDGVDGVPSGRLGVSSLTITNFLSSRAYVILSTARVAGPTCQSAVLGVAGLTTVYVDATSTLNLTFPTPLVIGTGAGPACLQASVPFGGNVFVLMVGKSE